MVHNPPDQINQSCSNQTDRKNGEAGQIFASDDLLYRERKCHLVFFPGTHPIIGKRHHEMAAFWSSSSAILMLFLNEIFVLR